MKKIISIVLLVALCLGLLAGCGKTGQEAVSNLPNARALVFNTYKPASKDEIPAKSSDFEVMTSVLVDGEYFPVEWVVEVTAGDKDAVKIVDGSSAAYKLVDVTEKPETEVQFTLTATIKDSNGNSESVSFKYMTPAFEAPTAAKVVIINVADSVYATGTEYQYTSSSGSVKMELVLTENKAEAVPFTLVNNEDGTVSFVTDCGKYLYCDATNVEFVDEASDFTKYLLDSADGGYYIKCAVANYNDKAQYLEVYSGYLTCYGMNESKAGLYIFALEDATGAAGTVVKYSGSTEPVDPEPTPEPDNSNDPVADSTLSVADAIALGASKAHNTYTSGKYYVTGVITEVYNEQYGNMKIADEEGNILTIYGTFDADGTNRYDAMTTKPVAGDTVTIYGIVGQYNDAPQIKNGWITAHTAAPSTEPTPAPSTEPTPEPTPAPSTEPTPEPTPAPSTEPTPEPTPAPSTEPTPEPTPAPSAEPTPAPSTGSAEDMAIVDEAYELKSGKSLSEKKTLTGTIVNINSLYDSQYKNISVDIRITGREGKPILCYRMKGEGVENLKIGDVITVTGKLKNYNGTIEFDTGCTLDKVVASGAAIEVSTDATKILSEAAALNSGARLAYNATLTGEITKIPTKYSSQYKNITVIILVNGVEVECYRMLGDGIKDLAVGDTITVSGMIMNYKGKIQFCQGSALQ